jgi:hypothetical protein
MERLIWNGPVTCPYCIALVCPVSDRVLTRFDRKSISRVPRSDARWVLIEPMLSARPAQRAEWPAATSGGGQGDAAGGG